MKRFLSRSFVVFLVATGCGTEFESAQQAVETLQCPAGQVAWNFSEFPVGGNGESLSQGAAAAITSGNDQPEPNRVQIVNATCDNVASLTAAAAESCDGRTSCTFTTDSCRNGAVRLRYTCTNGNGGASLICTNNQNCYLSASCPQPARVATKVAPRVACVPQKCHGATRRDANLACVLDETRASEYQRIETSRSPSLTIYGPTFSSMTSTFSPVARGDSGLFFPELSSLPPAVQASVRNAGAGGDRLLATYGLLFADTEYALRQTVRYVVPQGEVNRGLQGSLVFWLFDELGKKGAPKVNVDGKLVAAVNDSIFRCRVASIDMRKYGPGTPVVGLPGAYTIEVDERVVLPRDCGSSGSVVEHKAFAARREGQEVVAWLNSRESLRTRMAASYDLEGRVIFFDSNDLAKKRSTCAPNPIDFFYDRTAAAHDQFAYHNQRRVDLFTVSGFDWIQPEYRVLKPGLTSTGLSGVRPKQLVFKVGTAGPARGFIRADVDWFLSGDRDQFWQTFGLRQDDGAWHGQVRTYLVPLDANDQPVAEDRFGFPLLGQTRIFKSTPSGTTLNQKFKITEELRAQFLNPTSKLYVPADPGSKKFVVRSCLYFGTTSTSSAQRWREYDIVSNGCRDAAAPVVIKLDHSVAPLSPVTPGGFSDSQPQSAGDARMSQAFDGDSDRDCVSGGDCRTSMSNGVEGSGTFGGTVIKTSITGTNHLSATGQPTGAQVTSKVEMLGFTVLDSDETKTVSGPGTALTFTVTPPWDDIIRGLQVTVPGARWKSQITVGRAGLGIGFGYKVPVRYGLLQGDVIISFSVGVTTAANFTYTFKAGTPVACNGTDTNCEALYLLQPAAPLTTALSRCYAAGGRLADLTSDGETRQVRAKLAGTTGLWLGAQVANEYISNACLNTWASSCSTGHAAHLRWLSNDEDFATAKTFGAFTFDAAQVGFDGTTPAVALIPVGKPVNRGVMLKPDGSLGALPFTESYASVCLSSNTASATTHVAEASLELGLGAGISVAFCTPSEEAGVCLEGSVNIIQAKLTPKLTYTHHDLKDRAGRKGSKSNLTFSVDFDLSLFSAALDIKVKFGKWFSFSYNLFTFSGFALPIGDAANLVKLEMPLTEDFQ